MNYFRIRNDGTLDIAGQVEDFGDNISFILFYNCGKISPFVWRKSQFLRKWTPCTPLMEALI
jgi:hypothetical protein